MLTYYCFSLEAQAWAWYGGEMLNIQTLEKAPSQGKALVSKGRSLDQMLMLHISREPVRRERSRLHPRFGAGGGGPAICALTRPLGSADALKVRTTDGREAQRLSPEQETPQRRSTVWKRAGKLNGSTLHTGVCTWWKMRG